MRFGLLLSAVHDDRAPAELQLQEHLELTQIAVGYGFDLVMVGQHFLPERLRYYQPVPYLTWLGTTFPISVVSIQNSVHRSQVGTITGALNFLRALMASFTVAAAALKAALYTGPIALLGLSA